jgi:putative membrane protein
MITIARRPLMKTITTTSVLACAMVMFAGLASAALPTEATKTAEVLGKLHASNLKEINLGKLAEKQGQAQAVKDFGRTLVKDHTAADKEVAALAKQEKIDLAGTTPMESDHMGLIPPGPGFDGKFAQMMLDDHKKDIADATAARNASRDDKLKALLDRLIPVLQKHQETARGLLDGTTK